MAAPQPLGAPAVSKVRVAVLRLGRSTAMGETRRTQTWRSLFSSAGAEVHEVTLLPRSGRPRLHLGRHDAWSLLRGEIVTEALAWSSSQASAALERIAPAVTIFITSRAFRPELAKEGPSQLLDFVDELSTSYRDRGTIGSRGALVRVGFRALALGHQRFERRGGNGIRRVAAGFADAQRLDAQWVPVLSPILDPTGPTSDHRADLLFLGSLEYPPNIDAIRQLDRLWPQMQPTTSLVLAGRAPTAEVDEMARRHGWTIMRDFEGLETLRGIASVAIAPLRFTAGIQMKVLDAAALGIPQVATPAAIRGLAPGFPLRVAELGPGFVATVNELLMDPDGRHALAQAAAVHLAERYSVNAWAPWAKCFLDRACG